MWKCKIEISTCGARIIWFIKCACLTNASDDVWTLKPVWRKGREEKYILLVIFCCRCASKWVLFLQFCMIFSSQSIYLCRCLSLSFTLSFLFSFSFAMSFVRLFWINLTSRLLSKSRLYVCVYILNFQCAN